MTSNHCAISLRLPRIFLISCAAAVAIGANGAHAQYTPIAITPNPDVYGFLAANPSTGAFLPTAQPSFQFRSLTVFGDSYADFGNSLRATGGPVTPNGGGGRFGNGVNEIDGIQYHYGLATSAVSNYAVGGAESDNHNINANPAVANTTGTAAQIQAFLQTGRRFGPADLIDITTTGGNDGVQLAFNPALSPQGLVATVTANTLNNVQQLVNVGARNFALLSPGDPTLLPIFAGSPVAPRLQSYYDPLFLSEQQALRPLALSGVRIFLFDLTTLEQRLLTNPGLYGFGNSTQACINVPSCANGTFAAQNLFTSWDGLHFTTSGFLLISRYQTNQIDAPMTVTPQGSIVLATANSFVNSTFGHLDAYRNFGAYGTGGANAAYAADRRMPTKALPAMVPEEKRWSAYGEVNYAGGTQNNQLFGAGANFDSVGGTAGLEYQVSPDWKLGGVFSYAQPNANFGVQNAHLRIDALQFSGYSSYTARNWFADVLLAYGYQQLKTDRLGVIDVIRGSTNANLFTVAARAGYLFDVATLRVGPIGGLNYTNASIAGYTETGDVLLTQIVGKQTIDSLTGSAGVQFRLPFTMGNALYSPFVNVTAEHDFLGDGRIITTTQSTTLLLPVMTPTNSTNQTYGKVVAGVAGQLAGNVSGMINASTTFARSDGNFYGVNAGIKVAF